MNNAASVAAEFLNALHEREERQDDAESRQRFGEAYQRLTELARSTDRATQNAVLHALTAGFSDQQTNWEFGCLANTCGVVVELGGDPAIALDPVLDRITLLFARIPEIVQIMRDRLGVENPNAVAHDDWPNLGRDHPDHAWVIGDWHAIQFLGCAAMAMLCRDVESRQRGRDRIDLAQTAQAAANDNPYAYYVSAVLGMIDDEPLIVLDVPRRLGFRVRLTAVRNDFHLFTLLQDALLAHPTAKDWSGPRVSPLIVAVAKSERMLHDISPNEWSSEPEASAKDASDSAIWTYYSWHALKPDDTLMTMQESVGQLPFWIWGEGSPMDIPLLDGERVVLLGPLEMPRMWNVGFFSPLHPALRSVVEVEAVLTSEEYGTRIERIRRRR
ncbi:MAG: hypothetical protein HYR84_11255 [Planctomycetes bacterium]|nr:hypothetical protein [Planctomycetota bacterium]